MAAARFVEPVAAGPVAVVVASARVARPASIGARAPRFAVYPRGLAAAPRLVPRPRSRGRADGLPVCRAVGLSIRLVGAVAFAWPGNVPIAAGRFARPGAPASLVEPIAGQVVAGVVKVDIALVVGQQQVVVVRQVAFVAAPVRAFVAFLPVRRLAGVSRAIRMASLHRFLLDR
ncbi:hypothetical protein ACNSZH_24480 [Burkholderia gladioli]|uniref:hypothetical protein n=1 Tax=Burkholderia gladioli TaxID=28095 RepID=UPI003B98539C